MFLINRVASEGCEITNEDGKIIGWSIDSLWAETIKQALEMYIEKNQLRHYVPKQLGQYPL